MSKNLYRLLGLAAVAVASVLVLGLVSPQGANVNAQTKVEVCDNKVDDDDDKLIDCDDPDCKCEPPKGTPCSPGYWKAPKHRDEFLSTCVQVPGWTCDELYTAITCKGSDSSCRRHEASEALNAINDCTE
jgi:hypothetical protein